MTLSAPVNTPAPSLFPFSLKSTYNSLFVTSDFPKPLLPLFQGLSKGYRGWEKKKKTFIVTVYI